MSTSYSNSKGKRPRSSSEPTQSFVKNVTSVMSGLLPATIIKWFSSSSSSNANGSAQVADATDSSTEDEAPEQSPYASQPPAKKTRYNAPEESSHPVLVETRCTSTNTETIDETYTFQSPVGRSNIRRENIFASTRVHSANDNMEKSTQDTFYKTQHSLSAIEDTLVKKRKSLFGTPQDDKKHGPSKSANVRDPYFKPSLLSSPFYVGRTMYGGAASSYLSPPSLTKKTVSLTNETSNNESVTMSHSARRVMDLLEHYSSPLIEAKRILQTKSDFENASFNNVLQQSGNPHSPRVYSYKTQELYVPSVASILTIKRKSRLMDSTNAARQIIASHSSSAEFSPYPKYNSERTTSDEVSGGKSSTMKKSRLTRPNRESNTEKETLDTLELPNVVLQIDKDNLPKFTFGPVPTSQPPPSSSIQTPVIITPEALKKTTESDKSSSFKLKQVEKDNPFQVTNNNDYYKFSTPDQISIELNKTSTPLNIIFETPQGNLEKEPKDKTKQELPSSNTNQLVSDSKLSVKSCSDWKCLDCWVMNKIDVNKCVCCGGKKPVEVDEISKKCSVCNISLNKSKSDICIACEKKTNKIDKQNFIKESSSTPKITASLSVSEDTPENEWKCNDCWIKNKSFLAKCAACGGHKPGSQINRHNNFGNAALSKDSQGDKKVKETLDSTFKSIAKSQSEKWECPLCLVRNESNRETCICCEANKPGIEKNHTKFNFHQPSEITFKFGIQPNNIQETIADIEPEECNMGEESETNNNILPKTPTFNFGIPDKKIDDETQSMDNISEAPKINFTFGVQKDNQMSPVRSNIFDIPSKPFETSKTIEEKPQEVPQMFMPLHGNESVNKNIGIFNTSVTSQVAPDSPALSPLQALNQNAPIKKDISFLGTSVVPSSSSETKPQQNNFTFPSIMPATNLFSTTPTTTTSMSNILPAPLTMGMPASSSMSIFQKTNIVTTTTSSFFPKSDSIPILGGSIFSKPESGTTTTTTPSAPMGTMQPVFSFGGQGSVPQAEKPKFNFNFTSNKTESVSPIFKPTFGVSTESNKFNLPTIGGNTLSGSSLNATPQMTAANALTTGNSNTTSPTSSMFGATATKENMWLSGTNNIFATNTTTNVEQKPPAFTFGAAFSGNNAPFSSTTQQVQQNTTSFGNSAQQTLPNTAPFGNTGQQAQPNAPFGSNVPQAQPNNAPFGSTTQQTQSNNVSFGTTAQQIQPNNTPFGSNTQLTQPNNAPFGSNSQPAQPSNAAFGSTTQVQPNNTAFGSTPQPTQPSQPLNVFGITNQTTPSPPSMFGSHLQSQTPPAIFGGNLQVQNNPMPMGMFGTPVVASNFGTMNPPIPTFETSTIGPAQQVPSSFNFGAQQSNVIFGFGQQQQPGQVPTQPDQPGMYGFGGAPQMKFTIGSSPNTTGRRVRKAMRRTQR